MGSWRRVLSGAGILILRKLAPSGSNSWNAGRKWATQSRADSIFGAVQWRPLFQGHRLMLASRMSAVAPETSQAPAEVESSKSAPEAADQEAKLEQTQSKATDKQEPTQSEANESEAQVKAEESKTEEQPKPKPTGITQPVSWLSFILMLVTAGLLVYFYDSEKKRRIENFTENNVKYGPSAGKAAIGGSFKLLNHDGKAVTEKDFMGNWTLIYFGFTSCPDICPDELQKMMQALDILEKKKRLRITPLFISIDPERDTVEQVRDYVKEFHPRLIGLTGSAEDVKQVAKKYRVYFMKTGDEGDEDYLVDHSIIMYLMDKDMEFVKFFGKDYTVNELADGIVKEIKNYKPRPKEEEEVSAKK